MTDHDEINSKSIVKAIADIDPNTKIGRAINFTRTPEASINGNYYTILVSMPIRAQP